MKKLAITFIVIGLVLLAGVNALLHTGLVPRLLMNGVKSATGLEVVAKGKTSVRALPMPQITMDDVVVTNPGNPGQPPVLTAKSLDIVADVGSLLWAYIWPSSERDMTVSSIRLTEPGIGLTIGKDGQANWLNTARPAVTGAPRGQVSTRMTVSQLTLIGATIEVRDEGTGASAKLAKVDLEGRNIGADRFQSLTLKSDEVGLVERQGGATATLAGVDLVAQGFQKDELAAAKLIARTVAYAMSAQKVSGTLEGLNATGTLVNTSRRAAGPVTVNGAALVHRDGTNDGALSLKSFDAGAGTVSGAGLGAFNLKAAGLDYAVGMAGPGWSLTAQDVAATADKASLAELAGAIVKAASLSVVDRTRGPAAVQTLSVNGLALGAGKARLDELADVTVRSTSLAYGDKGSGQAWSLAQASATISALSGKAPLDATFETIWNKERVTGRVRTPTPLLIGLQSVPATISLAAAKSTIEFDGAVAPLTPGGTRAATAGAFVPRFTGTTKASAASLGQLGQWLGMEVPAFAKGSASISGEIEATPTRVSVAKGRIEQDGTVATGSVAVDLSGPRPLVTGSLAADKLDGDKYLGGPAKPSRAATRARTTHTVRPSISTKDTIKAYLRNLLDAPVTRAGGLADVDLSFDDLARLRTPKRADDGEDEEEIKPDGAWSSEPIDAAPLKAVDLDLDVAVKSLRVRGFDIVVPKLKTVLKDGKLRLDGTNLTTNGGRLSGVATVDASQRTPFVETTFEAEGIDVYALLEMIGVQAVVAGHSQVKATLTGSGGSQREFVETLSGNVSARMGRGDIVGYNLSSLFAYFFSSREYDPSVRTPFNNMVADVRLDNGIARDSEVRLDGPSVGADAGGLIKLPTREVRYSGLFRIGPLLKGLPFRFCCTWTSASFIPDLGANSRSPQIYDSVIAAIPDSELDDPEIGQLVQQLVQRAGARGLTSGPGEIVRALQSRLQNLRR